MPYETDIEVQNQTARITIPIPGTDRSLAYASRRVEGYLPPRSITVPVTDEEFDPDDDLLKRVESTVLVEGNGYTATWSGDEIETGLNHEFTWDATDTYGRGIQGGAHVTGEIAHVYEGMHGSSNEVADRVSSGDSGGSGPTRVTGGTFDYPSSVSLDGGRNDTTFRLVNNWDMELYRYDAGVHGLGGWTVDAHHMLFDELRPTIEYGDGTKRSLGAGISETIETAELRESNPRGIATGSDGTVYAGSGSWVMKASAESLDESRGGFITLDEIELSEDSPVTFEDAGVFRDIAIGPDDEIYATDFNNEYVYKISTDGMMTVVAGTGDSAPDPGSGGREYHADIEGSLATEMDLLNPGWIDVGPEGDIYFVHGDTPRDDSVYRYIIRIRTNGRVALVNHYGSGGTDTEYLENAPVRGPSPDDDEFEDENWVHDVLGRATCMAVGPDNEIYLGEHGRIRRIDEGGNVSTVAGTSSQSEETIETGYAGDGGRATNALLGIIEAIDVAEDGTVYIVTGGEGGNSFDDGRVVRAITPDGRIHRVAGVWTDHEREEYESSGRDIREHSPAALKAYLSDVTNVSAAPDGTIHLTDNIYGFNDRRFLRSVIQSPLQDVTGSSDTLHVPSKDSRRVHEFDEDRRHRLTKNALTGETEVEFDYQDGLVSEITDDSGRAVSIERDEDGTATAIVSPGGKRTELEVDENGTLVGITYPDGRTFEVDYTDSRLVESITDPAAETLQFDYDDDGRLVGVVGPDGERTDYVHGESGDGHGVDVISPELRERTFAVETDGEGRRTYTNTCCGDLVTESVVEPEGDRAVTYPNDVLTEVGTQEDPRFGELGAIDADQSLTTPGGIEFIAVKDRKATLDDEDDAMSLDSFTETWTVNGAEHEIEFVDADSQWSLDDDELTVTTAAGRITTLTIADGWPATLELEALEPIEFTFEDGDLVAFGDGRLGVSYAYDDDGNPTAVAGLDGEATLAYDDAGRVTSVTGVDGELVAFEYDDADNLTAVTTPSGEIHSLAYTPLGELAGYKSPVGDEYELSYDGDGLVTAVDLPSGGTLDYDYDTHGRRETTTLTAGDGSDQGTIELDRGDDGTVTRIERTTADSSVTLELDHDGEFLTELVYGGDVEGTFAFEYNDDLNVTEVTLPSGELRSLDYDADGMRTGIGPFSLDRSGPLGGATTIESENLDVDVTYDDHGFPSTRTYTIDDEVVYEAEYEYDGAGRLSERTETVGGETVTNTYDYDGGRLVGVERDGSPHEAYEYDADGNLTSRTLAGSTAETTVDAQDQIETHDGVDYSYDADGFLTARGDDEFTYSVGGELLAADLDGSDGVIEYAYDGLGRRVARTDRDGTTEYLYGNPNDRAELTASRSPDGTLTTYYYDDTGRLFALERDDEWYYVAADQVGSPRAVFDANGTLLKELTYDSFGAVESDSNPSFELAVGFAGGIVDPATGLVRFWNRDYDPETGRWTARDPILFDGGQTNLYAYVDNDPVNRIDPSGLDWDCYWDRVGRDVDAAGSPFETFLEEAVNQISPELAAGLGLAKGGYDLYDDTTGAYKAGKLLGKGRGLAKAARAAGLPAEIAYQGGVRAGAALNPFAEHSLGETIGNSLYDRFN